MLSLHYILEGSQSYNLDPNTCHVKSSEGVRITNFKILQALSNLGTSKFFLFGLPSGQARPSPVFSIEKLCIPSTSTSLSGILLPLEEGIILNGSVASVDIPCGNVITIQVEEVSVDEPRPGSSKDLEDSSQEKQDFTDSFVASYRGHNQRSR